MSNWSVLARWSEHLFISEADIINCWVVRYKLCFNTLMLYVPDGAGGIDRRCPYHSWLRRIPIEWSDRSAVVRIYLKNTCVIKLFFKKTYISQNLMLFVRVSFINILPDSKIFCSCCQNVSSIAINIRNPHNFSGWKLMLKLVNFFKSIIWFLQT